MKETGFLRYIIEIGGLTKSELISLYKRGRFPECLFLEGMYIFKTLENKETKTTILNKKF